MKRAKQTSAQLSAGTGVPVVFEEYLMEWKNGLIAGLTREEAAKQYPSPEIKYPHTAIYEQESMIEFRARAEIALSTIINENPTKGAIVIVSHGGLINMLLRSFFELPIITNISFSTGDTGIHHLQINGAERRVVFANRISHLNLL